MPLSKRWTSYSNATIPDQIGIYELAYNKNCIYIGSGIIKDRITSHNSGKKPITHIRYEITNSSTRAVQRERAEIHSYGNSRRDDLPKYNTEIPAPPR